MEIATSSPEAVYMQRLKLFMAASFGDSKQLEQLLISPNPATEEAGYSVAQSEEGSALHVVATHGDSPEYLKSAEVIHRHDKHLLLARNEHGDTPLHCAARGRNTHMVSRLIKLACADDDGTAATMVRMQNNDGRTALHEAIGCDDIKMVRALMSVDKELARVDAFDGTSPLFLAISLGHNFIARRLHDEFDHDLSYSGRDGQNALHAAILHNQRMAQLLIGWSKEKIKNLTEERDPCGSTPIHLAASAEDPSLEFYLFAFADRSLDICSFGYFNIAPSKLLYRFYVWKQHPIILLADADLSSAFRPDKHGLCPVHIAASAGSLEPIFILLWHCGPGCAKLLDAQGKTFLHVAVEKKRLNVVRFACNRSEFKSMMNIQDEDGNTALHLAVRGGDWDIFRTLIWNRHVVLNLPNKDGQTPTDIAEKESPSALGFYFGMHARRRILGTLKFSNAQHGNGRHDHLMEECEESLEVKKITCSQKEKKITDEECEESLEDKKITDFAQIVGIGSVLVATATFAAAFTMPGGLSSDKDTPPTGKGGTPTLAGYRAFNGFIMSNTLAFICSALATFSLIYTGVAALDIHKRIKLVSFSLALLIGAARSFCAAFAFALYVLLAPVDQGAAIASCLMTVLALLDTLWFMSAIVIDTALVFRRGWVKLGTNRGWRSVYRQLLRLGTRFLANSVYLFWPYVVIFTFMAKMKITKLG